MLFKFDSYPLSKINYVISNLANAKLFSTLDLKSGYWQIEVCAEDVKKTVFATQFGLFE